MVILHLIIAVLLFFVGEVQSSHYRGGTISYRPNSSSPYAVDFTFRLSFRRGAVFCDSSRVASRSLASTSFSNRWQVTRHYWSYYTSSSSGSANIYCSDFNVEEDWSEGNNTFTYVGSYNDNWWNVRITDGGNWIHGITYSNSYDYMHLDARVNRTVGGAFNNSSPVTNLPLTVYVVQGIPSVIRIPVEDPDGDIVRCRNASYQECYRGMCTYFPHGVLDEGTCSLSYNGAGSVGQLFPIILKLEDFPSGTTQFDSSNSLGSVDLQFVVHITNMTECSNYTVLNTRDRSQEVHRGNLLMCDQYTLTPGWYRFMGDAGTAMPTSCVPMNHCGTHASGWVQGSHPTQAEGIVNRRVCYHWSNNCCNWNNNIRIKNCGGFYVYELVKPSYCHLRYCGNGTGTNNTCASNPCRNNGTCVATSPGYRCYCPYGYSGKQCETSLNQPCSSNPCRNGGTCRGGPGWYRCDCLSGYTGQQCQSYMPCHSNPCRNGGTCRGGYGWYRCDCPSGLTGQQCESNLNTNVTCGENYMQIDLEDSYFSDIDWRNLHLIDPSCRATKTADTRRLRAPLNQCGTTYTETQKTITFWNEVKTDNRYQPIGNGPVISRDRHLLLRFFCAYERSRFVSTSFSPSKKSVVASEGSYGNFTFTMNLYQTSRYRTPYSPFAYPVVVYPNQPLWVQYEVKNTNADLVVFAENCRATPSNDPNATPQHVFLQRGCILDRTMVYWYDPSSKVQRFSIRSFRFVYSNTFLVYLHCELLVCHRNTNNSRCAQGCISGSRRRRETTDMDGSKAYDLSAGPLKGGKINAKGDNQEGSLMSKQLIGGLGAVGGVFFVITILLSVIVYRNRRRGQDNKPTSIALDVTVNSYEQDNVDSDEKNDIEL